MLRQGNPTPLSLVPPRVSAATARRGLPSNSSAGHRRLERCSSFGMVQKPNRSECPSLKPKLPELTCGMLSLLAYLSKPFSKRIPQVKSQDLPLQRSCITGPALDTMLQALSVALGHLVAIKGASVIIFLLHSSATPGQNLAKARLFFIQHSAHLLALVNCTNGPRVLYCCKRKKCVPLFLSSTPSR